MKARVALSSCVAVVALTLCAVPAMANQITANVTADCTGYTITLTGSDLNPNADFYIVSYSFNLTPAGGPPMVISNSFDTTPGITSFTQSITQTWASLGITLNGSYSFSDGMALLTVVRAGVPRNEAKGHIGFAPDTLFCTPAFSCSGSVTSNFNGNAIPQNDTIWFNSVLNVKNLPSGTSTTVFMSEASITFNANNTNYVVNVPDATITFSPSTTLATTSYLATGWNTQLPLSGLAGNDFLTGVGFGVPAGGLPGGIHNITFNATFSSTTPGLNVNWQWAAAVYTSFSTNNNLLGVKPVDDNKASIYQNSDHAGTPENFKKFVTGGATGGGGSNFTGSYSGTASCAPQ